MATNIFIPTNDGLAIIHTDDILYLEAESNYTNIYLKDQFQTVSRSLKHFEDKLPPANFVRIHNRYIINIAKIKAISKKRPVKILLQNDAELPLSDTRKDLFFAYLDQFAIML